MLAHARRFRLVLAVTAAAALFAAGCGESEEDKKRDYRDGLAEADRQFDQELTRAGATMQAAGRAKSREQYGEGVEQLQTAVDDFKKELDELDTPDDAENEQEAVTEAVDEFAEAVGQINAAVQADDEEAIQAQVLTVREKGAEVDQAIETLKEAVE